MKLNEQSVDLVDLLRDVSDLFQPLAENRNIRIDVEAPGSALVRGDLKKLQRVFSNLIDECLEIHTRWGICRYSHQRNGQRHLIVIVRDNGNGITGNGPATYFRPVFQRRKEQINSGKWPWSQSGTSLC